MDRGVLRSGDVRPSGFRLGELRQRMPQRAVVGLSALWDDVARAPVCGSTGRAVQHLIQALRGIFSSPLNSALTIFSIAMVLALFGLSLALLDHVWSMLSLQRGTLQVSVYLDATLSDPAHAESRQALEQRLRSLGGVTRIDFVSRAKALELFQGTLGDQAGALAGLEGENPLPASFEVSFAPHAIDQIENTASQIRNLAGVEEVLFDRGVFSVLTQLLQTVSRIAWVVVPLLFVMVAFIIASTVRLALHRHQQEIAIMRLVGARHKYVRAPFLVGAVVQGILGGILGVTVLAAVHRALQEAIGDLGVVREVSFDLSIWVCVAVVIAGVFTGLVGSSLTLRRFSADV